MKPLFLRYASLLLLLIPVSCMGSAAAVTDQRIASIACDHAMIIRTPDLNNRSIRLSAARNEYEPFIISVDIPDNDSGEFSLTVGHLQHRTNREAVISASAVDLFRVENIEALVPEDPAYRNQRKKPPFLRQRSASFPDRLVPMEAGRINGTGRFLIWVRLHVGGAVAPGEYEGRIALIRNGATVSTVRISLSVFSFTLPHVPSFAYLVDLPRGKGAARSDSAWFWSAAAEVARNRCSIRFVEPQPRLKFDGNTSVLDFREYDASAKRLFDEMGMAMAQFPLVYIFGGHGRRIDNTFGKITKDWVSDEFAERYVGTVRAIAQHLSELGWLERQLFIFFDEPDETWFPTIKKVAALTKEADERLRPAIFGINPRSELRGYMRDWIGRTDLTDYKDSVRKELQARGDRYVTYNQWESFGLHTEPVFTRELLWWAWNNDINALIHYTMANWRDTMAEATDYWDALVYSGQGRPFVPSVRWEMLREGLEDYEYLVLFRQYGGALSSSGESASLQDRIRGIAATVNDRNLKPETLLSLRNDLALAIQAAMKKRND